MSNNNTLDPLKMWKEMYDQTEKFWGKAMNEAVHKEEYSAWMGSVLEMNLFHQKMMTDMTRSYLEKVNIPSKEDIASVASLIVNLEAKVDALEELIEEKLDELGQVGITKSSLTRLKNDVKAVDGKVELISSTLQAHGELLEKLQHVQPQQIPTQSAQEQTKSKKEDK
ncbi:polyhydroxyalkanoic acid synthase subunit PhaR [Priestia taiwanensis]|uniref:Polyhydroxyalkanoic acid synthase subunit PhaR n=1 Tax=Priestia taiwanensis TaxID=1347902 RepID=A0A917EPE6_9BACI|nr:polyhydroxyalkanoic acid synthase subunit PhaR [Priestia taiwanensis]MBM7364023.1 polyhydroxyalkanoic acid synthase PhaR subunit [Priestia taiwanensis]GGE71042.1 polyhydroxyalkanoic acid synthase subunit PhaR [Priestia taiwanensis]